MTASTQQVMTPFWLISWAFALAAAWLLPNHQLPWSSFHLDAWMAAVLTLGAAALILRTSGPVVWHGVTLMVAALVLVPGLQYCFGLVLLSGTAWISGAYLLGLLLALLIGARWEANNPGQLADGLFLAIGTAALLSVGLQLDQWLALESLDGLSMGKGHGRPFANFGQPNQLATFLLWGLLATAWGLLRRHIGLWTALLMMLYLLFGLALTQSQTAWLAVGLLVLVSWIWRRLWSDRRWPWLSSGLALYFAICVTCLERMNQLLLLGSVPGAAGMDRPSGALRQSIWSLFTDAALQSPWAGYGWNQLGLAQLAAALNHPSLEQLHAHAHNIFLDLVLSCGLPIGLAVSLYLVRWIWLRVRAARAAEDAVLVLFLLVIGLHAMLELPLHYAYFLLPVGLVMGALNVRLHAPTVLLAGRWTLILLWLTSAALLATLIRDYSRIETSYQELRFEQAPIKFAVPGRPPDVLLLTQLREFIRLSRFEPTSGMIADDLDWMRRVAKTYPGTAAITKLATALALNGQPAEAQQWLRKVCKLESAMRCEGVRQYWADQSLKHAELAATPWPNSDSATPLH